MPAAPALLVTFARPEESRAFRLRLARVEQSAGDDLLKLVRGKLGTADVVVAHTGIGAEAANSAVDSLLAREIFRIVIGAGFAGALDPKLAVGDTVLEEFPPQHARRIVSAPLPVETVAAKRALRAQTGAEAVDMETDALAAVCANAAVPFLAIRAISDPANTDLPVPFTAWFDLRRQRPRPFGLLFYLARNPRKTGDFVRFVRVVPRVSEALALGVEGSIRALDHI